MLATNGGSGDLGSATVSATAIGAGLIHSCALTGTGGVKCWGYNYNGQLGDGTTRNRSRPVEVSGLTGGATAIAAGGRHSCALTRVGGVKCWGNNSFGQLGEGATGITVDRLRPVDVVGFGPAKATLAIVSGSVRVTPARTAAVKLRCGAQAGCQGTLTLTASVNRRLVGSSARRIPLKLGSGTFSIAAGRTGTVKVRLTARGFKLLVRVERLPTRVRIRYAQPDGSTTAATRRIMLTAPKVVKR